MTNNKKYFFTVFLIISIIAGCEKKEDPTGKDCESGNFFCEYSSRNFEMGFSTWAYSPTIESVTDTYQFIDENSDIYSEHIDSNIPWKAWMNNQALPAEFTTEIASRASRKISGKKLTVSVSLLNSTREELAYDFDGTIPDYQSLNDPKIEEAYFQHLKYIFNQLNPDYFIIAIEVNELLKNAPDKWEGYKLLMNNLRPRIKAEFPSVHISESITLHNLYQPDVPEPESFVEELVNYMNSMDFVSISFYPYFKGLKTSEGFQNAFDFLHERINKPIVFAETSHLSEDLTVDSFNLFIAGNQSEQNLYLQTLLTNAQTHNYIYVIWWAHRDYNELWETFPEELKDLGKLWISTGIINEDGIKKEAYLTWDKVLNTKYKTVSANR
jgi:hypothetical protein